MRPNQIGLAFALVAALASTACASRRAPPPTAADTPPPLSTPAPGGTAVGAAPINPVPADPTFGAGQANIPASGPGSRQDFVTVAGERVYFETDSYTLRDDALPVLQAQAQWLQRYPGVLVTIEGNADERGTREYNLGLGARRAQAVRERLIQLGLRPERIATISYGKERPLDPGSNEEAWQRNRNARTNFTGYSD